MRFINVENNVRVAIEDLNPEKRNTIVLIHGWPLSGRIFEYQVNMLADMDYRVVIPDIRGFGQSDCPATGYDYNTLARDLHIVINSLNLTNISLLGFSMGGAIVLRYMSKYNSNMIKRVGLIGAAAPRFIKTPESPGGTDIAAVNSIIDSLYIDRPKTVSDFGKNLFYSNPSEELRRYFTDICFDARGISTIKALMSLRDENLTDDLMKLNKPTTIFHGKHDLICPYELALEMKNIVKDAKLLTYENSGHALFYDEMNQFNLDLTEFAKG